MGLSMASVSSLSLSSLHPRTLAARDGWGSGEPLTLRSRPYSFRLEGAAEATTGGAMRVVSAACAVAVVALISTPEAGAMGRGGAYSYLVKTHAAMPYHRTEETVQALLERLFVAAAPGPYPCCVPAVMSMCSVPVRWVWRVVSVSVRVCV